MPPPIPFPVRQVIVQRAQQGQSAGLIARCLGLVPRSVRQWLQRLRMQGPNALVVSYPSQPYPHSAPFRTLVEEALPLRRAHPTWGAGLVRVLLHRHYPAAPLPAERTLQRWFRRADLIPAPRGRRSGSSSYHRAPPPHDGWQMDAADQVALQNGTQVCWLRIAAECSGAVLETAVFPPGLLEHGARQSGAGRVAPGVSPLGPSPALAPGQRHSLGCDGCMDVIQREEYPSLQGRRRLAVYPGLKHSGRAYSRRWERQHWRLDLVLEHLAGYAVPRQVDRSGTVSIYNKSHYVGRLQSGKTVYVSVDPVRREWLFRDEHGNQVRAQPAEQLCRERIETLTVASRR